MIPETFLASTPVLGSPLWGRLVTCGGLATRLLRRYTGVRIPVYRATRSLNSPEAFQ
jgi:hypothetical protein